MVRSSSAFLLVCLLVAPLTSLGLEVRLNEVYYHDDGENQWVEVYNSGSEQVDMSGWIFSRHGTLVQGEYFVIPDGTALDSEGFLLLCANSQAVKARFNVPEGVDMLDYGGSCPGLVLETDGDDIYLLDADLVEVDVMWYGDGGDRGPFEAAPRVAFGHSLGRFPDGQSTGIPSADFYDYRDPTPGLSNPPSAGIDKSTWGKIKAMYSAKKR